MRKIFVIGFMLAAGFTASAQKTPPSYYYTAASERYLSDAEVDSLFYQVSESVFKENRVPVELLRKNITVISSMLAGFGRNKIIASFKSIESAAKKKINAPAGSPQYLEYKKLYTGALVRELRNTFYSHSSLKPYITLATGDRITSFKSTIRIGADGKLLVQEKISIYNGDRAYHPVYGTDSALQGTGAVNDEIRRGIFRTFPLYYVNRFKLFQNTTFQLKEVLRNGKPEKSRIEKKNNGLLVYTGSSDYYLPAGHYTYTITYETGRQLKQLSKFDELYWNVTGNSWSFRIDSAVCTVILPRGATSLSNKCYTGKQGSTREDCRFTVTTAGDSTVIVFKTTEPLLPNEGITIASSWPKGFVKGPGIWRQLAYYIWNNKGVFFLPLAALFSALFCFVYWMKYGRDPDKGTIYPQFTPPAGYSPAALGYIYFKKFDQQLTAATIVDAAVRNKIAIHVEREGKLFRRNAYNIRRTNKPVKPTVSDYQDFEGDVQDLVDTTIEKGKYNSDLASLNKAVQKYCEGNYKRKDGSAKKRGKGFFQLNNSFTTLPGFVCVVAAIWGFIGGVIKAAMLKNFWHIGYFVAGVILCILVIRFFSKLLQAYSPEGRKLMDAIEGFRMFLSTADEKRFDSMNPPEKSLELYEKYLPFAIALGCEIAWGEKFEEIIHTAYLSEEGSSYITGSIARDHKSFSSSFSAGFGGAISSASTPPSSSSGGGSSFGGGSSGGGGGGGGGGGW